MRIHLARIGDPFDAPVDRLEQLAALDRCGVHSLVSEPDQADVILFSQSHMLHTDWRLTRVARHARRFADIDRVMVFDERDRPWCRFPGVYVSMPTRHFDDCFQRAWAYFPREVPSNTIESPDLLFSFVGSMTHMCRRPLLTISGEDAVVEAVSGFTFYDPSSKDFVARRQRYIEVLGRSRFVLCPRGQGTSSIRLYEALSIGRVPVIISDEWVPPRGPNWGQFSLRWPEYRTAGLYDYLRAHEETWSEMSAAAKEAHAKFFAPNIWFHHFAELLDEVQHQVNPAFPKRGVRGVAFLASGTHAWHGRLHEFRGRLRRYLRDVAGSR